MKKILLLLSISLLIVSSCKKDNNKQPDKNPGTCLLTESTFNARGTAETGKYLYTYDAKGRVTQFKYEAAYDSFTEQYTYSNDQIVLKNSNNLTITYKLDAAGRIVKANYSDNNEDIVFTYDTQGYLVQDVSSRGFTTKYAYTNGNLTTVQDHYHTLTIAYNTDAAQENFIDDHVNELPRYYHSFLKAYFGKASKNSVSKASDNLGYYEDYIYEKDTRGNIVKFSVIDQYGLGYVLNSTYNCQ